MSLMGSHGIQTAEFSGHNSNAMATDVISVIKDDGHIALTKPMRSVFCGNVCMSHISSHVCGVWKKSEVI